MKHIPLIFITSLCIVSFFSARLAAAEMPEFFTEEPLLETDGHPFNLETEEDSSEDDERSIFSGFSSLESDTSASLHGEQKMLPRKAIYSATGIAFEKVLPSPQPMGFINHRLSAIGLLFECPLTHDSN